VRGHFFPREQTPEATCKSNRRFLQSTKSLHVNFSQIGKNQGENYKVLRATKFLNATHYLKHLSVMVFNLKSLCRLNEIFHLVEQWQIEAEKRYILFRNSWDRLRINAIVRKIIFTGTWLFSLRINKCQLIRDELHLIRRRALW
jgi:hypothetical protein